jgi:hypothetical protein
MMIHMKFCGRRRRLGHTIEDTLGQAIPVANFLFIGLDPTMLSWKVVHEHDITRVTENIIGKIR